MSLIPPVLCPSSLYKEEAKRDATHIKTYNMILSQIYNKIKTTSRIAGSNKIIWYVVPEFIPGVPRFNIEEAIIYIVWNLRNAGYTVDFVYPTGLYISWKSYDDRYHKTESPWSKVLQSVKQTVNTTVSAPIIASKPTIKEFNTSSHSVTVKPAAQEVIKRKTVLKKTTEYKPPSTDKPSLNILNIMGDTPTATATVPVTATSTIKLPGQLSERHVSFV